MSGSWEVKLQEILSEDPVGADVDEGIPDDGSLGEDSGQGFGQQGE